MHRSHRHTAFGASSRRGNYAWITAISATVVLGSMSVAIDHMYHSMVTIELQNATDASAHAAANMLDGSDDGVDDALVVGKNLYTANYAHGASLDSQGVAISLGYIDDADVFQTSTDESQINSVKVEVANETFASLFSKVIGIDTLNASAVTIAQGGGPGASKCPLPIAFPTCNILELGGLEPGAYCNADLEIRYSPAPVDNVSWALINDSSVGAADIRKQLTGCTHTSFTDTSDLVSLNNGMIQNVLNALGAMITDGTDSGIEPWDTSEWGAPPTQAWDSDIDPAIYGTRALVGEVVMFDDDPYCAGLGGSFNDKDIPVAGYATIAMFDVSGVTGAGDLNHVSGDSTAKIRVLCNRESDQSAGGAWGGTVAAAKLVQ